MEDDAHVLELHKAIRTNDLKSIVKLIKKLGSDAAGVFQKEVSPYGTSLHLAAKISTPEVIKVILRTGVDVNVRHFGHVLSGLTPLQAAVLAGNHENMACLLDHQADLHAVDGDGLTALHYACQDSAKMDMAQRLVKKGGDVNRKDHAGCTPLQVSVLRSSAEITNFLINQGADIRVLDNEGQGLLHYAAELGNNDFAKMLLKRGADVNLQDSMGRTPLHNATKEEVRNLLIAHGADVKLRDKKGRPAIDGHIDLESEENKHLEAILRKKFYSMKQNPDQKLFLNAPEAKEIQEQKTKGIPKADPASAQIMNELLTKVKPCDDGKNGQQSNTPYH